MISQIFPYLQQRLPFAAALSGFRMPAFPHNKTKEGGKLFVDLHIFYMVVGRRQGEYFFPAICKISDLTWVEGDLAAPFHVFLINTGGGGTVKVDPADRPEIVGTFVIVFIFTIQQGTAAFGKGILLSQIGERAAACLPKLKILTVEKIVVL